MEKTYKEVAEKYNMPDTMKKLYIEYMTIRWAHEEKTQCQVGYAQEWAIRFLGNYEYDASDEIGKVILKYLYKKLENGDT